MLHRHDLYTAADMECLMDDGVIKKGKLPPEQEVLKELYLFVTDRAAYHAYRHKKFHKKRCAIS